MRAKTLAIAMVSFVSLLAPVAQADCTKAVDKILGLEHVTVTTIEKSATVDACGNKVLETSVVAPATVVVETTTTLPATITTIIPVPDDMNIRQRELKMNIEDRLAEGKITSSEAACLKTAMNHVDSAEANFRSDGHVSFKEAKTLYRAMDRVGSDLDFYVEDPSIFGLPLRTGHVLRNWSM